MMSSNGRLRAWGFEAWQRWSIICHPDSTFSEAGLRTYPGVKQRSVRGGHPLAEHTWEAPTCKKMDALGIIGPEVLETEICLMPYM